MFKTDATVPEIRFAVAEPGLDIGNAETALEALTEGCYYLAVERNRYHFSLKENLNKRFADRRATRPRLLTGLDFVFRAVFGADLGI